MGSDNNLAQHGNSQQFFCNFTRPLYTVTPPWQKSSNLPPNSTPLPDTMIVKEYWISLARVVKKGAVRALRTAKFRIQKLQKNYLKLTLFLCLSHKAWAGWLSFVSQTWAWSRAFVSGLSLYKTQNHQDCFKKSITVQFISESLPGFLLHFWLIVINCSTFHMMHHLIRPIQKEKRKSQKCSQMDKYQEKSGIFIYFNEYTLMGRSESYTVCISWKPHQ